MRKKRSDSETRVMSDHGIGCAHAVDGVNPSDPKVRVSVAESSVARTRRNWETWNRFCNGGMMNQKPGTGSSNANSPREYVSDSPAGLLVRATTAIITVSATPPRSHHLRSFWSRGDSASASAWSTGEYGNV